MTSVDAPFFSSNSEFQKNIVKIEDEINRAIMSASSISSQERPADVPPVSTAICRSPEVKWAQRVDKIYLTVLLSEAKNAKVNLTPDGVFTFSATAGTENHAYGLKLDLFGKVNVEESKINMGTRSIFCVIEKAGEGWWKKLLRGDQKNPHYLKVDWDKWVDEDEDEDTSELDLGGMDFSKFGGMDGLGGMEDGFDDESSDEDEEVEKPGEQETEKTEVTNPESKTEAVSST